jgi:hypothetical protein
VKLYSKSDMVHMMLKLKYVLPLLLNPKTYYLLHHFQICLKVRVALLALRGHIIGKKKNYNVGYKGSRVEKIPSLQHIML